jgi:hypothetical protein
MNRRIALVVLALLMSSCKKKEEVATHDGVPVKSVAAGMDMVEYREPSGAFQLDAPATWRADERNDFGHPELTMIGPGSAGRPNSVTISVARYPNTMAKSADPKSYYDAYALIETIKVVLEYGKRALGGREVESYAFEKAFRKMHSQKTEYFKRHDYVIVRVPEGFWQISHSAPADEYKATYPIFEAVVASFKPGPIPAPK